MPSNLDVEVRNMSSLLNTTMERCRENEVMTPHQNSMAREGLQPPHQDSRSTIILQTPTTSRRRQIRRKK
jgi:hypothetical protein